MSLDMEYVLFVIRIVNSLLHMLGFHALVCVYKLNDKSVMQLLLCNISLIEAVRNFAAILLFVPSSPTVGGAVNVISRLHLYIRLFGDVIKLLHFSGMMMIIINRFLITRLDWQYNTYCTLGKAKIIAPLNWLIASIVFISILAWHLASKSTSEPDFSKAYLLLDVVYLLLVCIAYGSRVYEYFTTPLMQAELVEARIEYSWFQLFQRSRFFIIDLLIASFLLLSVFPGLVLNIISMTAPSDSYLYPIARNIFVPVSDFAHAFVLYFIQKDTRRIFTTSFTSPCCIRVCNSRRRQSDASLPDADEVTHEDAIEMYKI